MRAQISLGRIFGVQIGLHYSWFFIAILVTMSLVAQFQTTNPQWGAGTVWGVAILTALLFFAALLTHELSHAMVARARGLPVRGITLFALGGVSETERDAADARTEFLIGIIGPATSMTIGLISLGIARALGWEPGTEAHLPAHALLIWLGYINIALALFNLIPGFPLDGGRVLRAIIWWATGDVKRSTRIASYVGQVVAYGLMILGLLRVFSGSGLGGLWLAFIGWFLLDAARASYAMVEMNDALRGVRVGDAMTRDVMIVDGRLNLQTFVEDVVMRTGQRCFIVADAGQIVGLITPHEVKKVERNRWPYTTVNDVMRPVSELQTVTPDAPVEQALEVMGREDVNQLPVTRGGWFEGVISRGNILRLLRNRAELQI